ncbi:GNAT family N-acetyltransferase [Nonomuraea sp. NPDC049421]|uniref:GNAT family N-acetyltransferase n=1 Tax=Nonomuraea sp. NPDC049421 TaxID=3155275 RepID=UPI0034483F87
MISLTTERLLLRRPTEDDIDPLAAMDADPEVMRYIGDGSASPFDRDRAAAVIARAQREWDERGFGMLSVVVRDTHQFAGWVALTVPAFLPEILPAVEIGWRLSRRHWGAGLATEAAGALLRYGLIDRGLDRVVSVRHVDNHRSKRVMDKIGMRFGFDAVVPATGRPAAVHEITRAEYVRDHDGSAERPHV